MPYLLNLLYAVLLLAASPWLVWSAYRKGKYQAGWGAKFFGLVPRREGGRHCVWLHAVSVGEVNLLAPLLRRLQGEHPNFDFVLSTTTKTGFELATKKYSGVQVCYCPLDFSWAVNAALQRIRPDLLILAELELWPNLIRAARRRGVKIAVVNGRLSPRSARGYARIRWFIRPWLRSVDLIAVQTPEYAERFLQLGALPAAVHVTGSMKFDGAQTDRQNERTRRLAKLAGVEAGDVVFLAGSTQSPEEELAVQAFCELRGDYPQLRLILAPRHPERTAEVINLPQRAGLAWRRRSELDQPAHEDVPVLLIDTIGELGAWWGTADIGYVGGSMGTRGGQNMIEPAAYGVAVSFGPRTHNFRDVVQLLLSNEAAVVVRDNTELTAFVRRCLGDRAWKIELGRRAQRLIATQLGATDRTMQLVAPLLPDGNTLHRAA